MVYRILESKDVNLSNIGRSLKDSIPQLKTDETLNLIDYSQTSKINNNILLLAHDKIDDQMVKTVVHGYIPDGDVKIGVNISNNHTSWKTTELWDTLQPPNITGLLRVIAYYKSIYLRIFSKLKIIVQIISTLWKRFFGVPSVYNYLIVDRIYEVLKHSKQGLHEIRYRIGMTQKVSNYRYSRPKCFLMILL
jgi:hypothetical protein